MAVDSFTPPLSAHNAQGGTADQDDPFLWDTETLTRELCSKGHPWLKHPDALAAKLAEEEVDGCTLLTYDFHFSKKELLECLGITTARGKAGLAEAVLNLQAKSKAFRSWKRNMLRNQSQLASDDDEKDRDIKNEPSLAFVAPQYPGSAPKESVTRSPDCLPSDVPDAAHLEPRQAAVSVDGVLFDADGDSPMHLTNGDADLDQKVASVNGTTSPRRPRNDVPPVLGDQERTPKRRRLAPTNLSTKPLPGSDIFALKKTGSLNLVDTVQGRSNHGEASHAGTPEYAYLGDKGRHRKAVLSHSASSGSPWSDLNGREFAVLSWEYIVPPGQRIVTNSLMKRHLRDNSRKEAAFGGGTASDRSSTPSDGSEDVLDLDDLPDSWDEVTQREIDEEKAEMAAMERELARNIPIQRVEAILKDEMALMKTKWIENKLPRYQRKAHQLWMAAKRNQKTIKEQIFRARRDAEHYDQRIKKLYAEITANTWQTERELRTQACVMEQTLSDKLYSTWLIELLEKREAPPKPLDLPKPKAKRPAPEITRHPFGDEILTSSDEEEFIVPDDDGDSDDVVMLDDGEIPPGDFGSPVLHHTRDPSPVPSDAESCMKLDLSGLESPEQLRDSKETAVYIDLISPTKPAHEEASGSKADQPASSSDMFGVVPPMDQLGSLEMIGQHPPQYWARQKDRWRLLLCLLWKLPQTRREWVLRFMQDKTSSDAWQASVRLYQMIPFAQELDIGTEERETVAFDITKLFLSCTQCRQYTEVRVMVLDKRDNNRIKRAESFFPAFHAFIRDWAPRFPKSSQIFRTDAFDDELGVDESEDSQLSSTESPSKMRKHAAREIVQNKEGVDLREREKRRAQELEARRVKLRAALATSNAISSDKSRLIINETKQDGQSFIYVNEEIGKRIKDHQINGVRFLWNQIIVDAEMRQGCLLAHTMGLGKTMQVITFLVAVLEAANSQDESIRAQIPRDLKKSQTVILCPAGLVDNWLDEILMWSPRGLLGNVLKFESGLKGDHVRLTVIKDWERNGGVIVMGHTMFWRLSSNVRQILTGAANLVICDEAHAMKNAESRLHQACQEFRTRSRIALTGSPLSNNVQEYYSMINWVAPNFLGPVQEFRDIYANPIEHGLWKDSSGYEKRRALKLLEVLKMNVAPKVQRATTQVVRHELPAKYEFVIFVEATPLQKRLYDIYLNGMASTLENAKATRVIGASQHLRLICNHPRCFRQKMVEASRDTAAPQPRSNGRRSDEDEDSAPVTAAPFPRSMVSTVLKETIGDIANPTLSRRVELLLMILDEARAIKDKVLLFSHSLLTLDYLEDLLKQQRRAVCRLDGSTAVGKRQEQIKAFNTGDSEIYLISTKAGGVGLNIYGANRVVIFDFGWNPVSEQQAVGRAYRFGQEKTVYVYQFVTSGAFEEQLQNKNVFKMQLSSRVVDKKNPVIFASKIKGLLRPITTKPAKDLSPFANRDRILDKLIEYAQPRGIIREIISTDTFEEEDPTNELTAEERKDAQELHDMERLKTTDPVRYRQMRDQRQRNEQIRAMADAGRAPTTPLMGTPRPMQHPYIPSSSAPATVVPSNGNPHPVGPAMAVPSNGDSRPSAAVPSTQPPAQTQPAAAVPSTSQVSGVCFLYDEPLTETETSVIKAQGTPQLPSSAPMPIAGANTYILKSHDYVFQPPATPANMQARQAAPSWNSGPPNTGQPNQEQPYHGQPIPGLPNLGQPTPGQSTPGHATPRQQTPRPETGSTLTGTSLVTSPSGRPSIFSQPRSQAKDEFQIELARSIANQPVFAEDHEGWAERVTAEIALAQRRQALGFLPDNARWRLLLSHIQKHPRFVLAILLRNCTPEYLVSAPEDEIETRISVMNDESEVSFLRRLKRCTAPPDPSNLNNINRPLSQSSARASEDVQVMRRAAEKRTDRRFRLPAWGYDALSKLKGPNQNPANP
ncbi:Protein CHROMATIN REMODELING 20 [Trichoderma ghanense]|uniref:Protein CHROMATIN REMODELING 20 n=1 Tax=Trichoderma ghanense TaxID=65468 RepID=A0ABY2HCP6_9HYPO